TNTFDRMLACRVVELLKAWTTITCLSHPVACKCAGLNLRQKTLHALLCLVVYNHWPTRHVSKLRRVGDGVTHLRDAAFVKQIDNQFHLVQTLEVSHLGRVTSLSQSFEA